MASTLSTAAVPASISPRETAASIKSGAVRHAGSRNLLTNGGAPRRARPADKLEQQRDHVGGRELAIAVHVSRRSAGRVADSGCTLQQGGRIARRHRAATADVPCFCSCAAAGAFRPEACGTAAWSRATKIAETSNRSITRVARLIIETAPRLSKSYKRRPPGSTIVKALQASFAFLGGRTYNVAKSRAFNATLIVLTSPNRRQRPCLMPIAP